MAIDFNKYGKSTLNTSGGSPSVNATGSTTTPQPTPAGINFNKYGKSTGQTSVQPQVEKPDGFIKSLAKAPTTIIARIVQAPIVAGASIWGGEEAANKTADTLDKFSRENLGGFVAPIPREASDIKKDVGRAAQTVAYGTPGLATAGALYGAGSSLEKGNNLLSTDTATEAALSAAGGKLIGVGGEAIAKAIPQPVKDYASKAVGKAADFIMEKGGKKISDFASNTQLIPKSISKAIDTGLNKAESLFNKPVDLARELTKRSEKQLEKNVLSRFNKGIKPSTAGKISQGQVDKYEDKALDAVKTINENKAGLSFNDDIEGVIAGKTPKTLQQMSEAIAQTKKNIFKKYNAMSQSAGEKGINITTDNIIKELDNFINDKAVQATNPKAAKYAAELKDFYTKEGVLNPEVVEDIIASNNTKLKNFMSGRASDQSSSVAVDSLVTNILRKNLDEGITNLAGPGYTALKKQYGNLSAIEKDVVKAALRDANKSIGGGVINTIMDATSGGQLAYGLVNSNPGVLASAATQKGITALYKYLNNPNRAIAKMFETVEKIPAKQIPVMAERVLPDPNQLRLEAPKMYVTPKGKATQNIQEAADVAAVEQGTAKQPKAGKSDRKKLKEMLSQNEPYMSTSEMPKIDAGTTPKPSSSTKRLKEVYGDLPTIEAGAGRRGKNSSKGSAATNALVAGSTLAGAGLTGASKLKSMYDQSNTQKAPVAEVQMVDEKPTIVKTEKMPGGRVVHTLKSGNKVVDIHPDIKKQIDKVYKKYPNIDKGVLEALVMKESSGGYDDTNRNPNIGKYAWIGGIAGKGGARDEFNRLGIDYNLDSIEGTLDAMAKYWTLLQKRKGVKDPIDLYDNGYSSGKLKKSDIDKFSDFINYYKTK